MTIITQTTFRRVHNNGSVLVEVPAGTKIKIEKFYGYGAWTVTAPEPVTKDKKKEFRVSLVEYRQLVGG